MKLWRPMLVMLLCSGLIVAFGLTACGGDDEVDCAGALSELQDSDCENAATTAIRAFRTCVTACPEGDQVCEEGCEGIFDSATSACEPATTLIDECGCSVCGNNFEDCIDGVSPAEDCVDEILDCFIDCLA